MSNHDTLIQQMEPILQRTQSSLTKKLKRLPLVQGLHYKKLEKQLKKDVKK